VEPLRDGRLCLTTVVELARVITPENRAEVLPRFFYRSRREAKQIAVEIRPAEVVPKRTVVTGGCPGSTVEPELTELKPVNVAVPMQRPTTPSSRTEVEPLTPRESRIHITVSPEFALLLK
jgi:hypothetical protein